MKKICWRGEKMHLEVGIFLIVLVHIIVSRRDREWGKMAVVQALED